MTSTTELLHKARRMRSAGNIDGAIQTYEEVLASEPDHAGALHSLGVLLNRREDFGRALELLERAVVPRPNDAARHVELGESYRNLGDYRNAIGCCRTALRLRPDFPEALNTLGLALRDTGDLSEALRSFQQALMVRPNFAPSHTNAAMVLQESGVLDEAIEHFRRAAESMPRSVLARTNLGLALLDDDRASEALSHFQEAARLRPDLAIVHHNLGNALRLLGRTDEAEASYRDAIRLDPDLKLATHHLEMMFLSDGSPDGAETSPEGPAPTTAPRSSPTETSPILLGGTQPAETKSLELFAGAGPQELETLDEANGLASAIADLEPGPARTRLKLGRASLARGRAAEALARFREALGLRPDLGVLHHHVGDALLALGRHEEARASYLKAIRLGPDLARAFLRVGTTLRLEGTLEAALKWHELAIEMEPDNPSFWAELADLHQKRDEADKAVECRRRVLELSPPDRVDARIDLGEALQEDGRPEEALEQIRIALRTHPDSPRPHFALSGILEEWGDMSEAEAEVRAAIRLLPRFPAAHARLANLLRGKLPDEDLETVEQLLADRELTSQPRARLLFALAHVLDARGDYPRAAECLREANALALELKRAEGVVDRPGDFERFVGRLIDAFDADFFQRTAGLGLETPRPVFVVGLPRSGTTLVEQILASHPRIHGAGERMFGRRSFEKLPAITGRKGPPVECVARLDERGLKRLAGEHLGNLDALDPGRHDRIVDKLPDNFLYLGLLAAMFPSAVFIHCRRDLRDVAVSCWMSDFRSIRWANDAAHIASRFRQYSQLVEHWKKVFPSPVLEVDYSDTVSDLEGTARRLIAACRLEWEPACLDFHRTRRVVRTASLTQVRQPIYTSSMARWKHYENELAGLFAALARDDGPA